MTIYDKIKIKLEQYPDFRERRLRRDKLVILALRDLKILGENEQFREGIEFSMDNLVDFASKYDSYRHEWDACLRDNPHLRGEDYEDKTIYEQKAQMEFGYEPGYYQPKLKLS